jgi:hypothetical protein
MIKKGNEGELNHVKFWDGLDEWCELSWKDEKQ